MKVLKFGGTSVGTTESLKNVKKIIERNREDKIIVVVSALGGITDRLIEIAREAAKGGKGYRDEFEKVINRHLNIIDSLLIGETLSKTKVKVESLLHELSDIYEGLSLICDLSERTLDTVMSYGERMSSVIINGYIGGSVLFDSRKFILTETRHGKHIYDKEASAKLIEVAFQQFLGSDEKIAIVPGFIASDAKTGTVTNLGRGGSDYTASIIAATLDASVLEIWTDVDGFMTADPKVIGTAYAIDHLSFSEAMELCNFGAKVVYPPTIYPVYKANIPILIKNTFNPEAKGTTISSNSGQNELDGPIIKGISSISNSSLISISGLGMVGIPGINARIFSSLAKNEISVFMVSQASSENSTSLAVRDSEAHRAKEILQSEFSLEIANGSISEIRLTSGLSSVAIVGANIRHAPSVAGKLFNTLGRNGINIIAFAQGSNQTNISFIVDTKSLRKTLNVIHDSFFLSQTQVLNLFIIGTGNVGKSLLKQIQNQQPQLLEEKSLEIKVVGIANSRKSIFSREGIGLDDYENLLYNEGTQRDPQAIEQEVIHMNIFNPVFVDCTSNPEIAKLYRNLLLHNVNVVAANKFSASGPIGTYFELKNIARRKDVKFLFETNVGAGLPIISTLNSLINSGDKIIKIEAVLSGTLNYIFNVLSKEVSLAKAVEMARDRGYAEADPRVDLSGDDVVRKIVILARESGYEIEQEDVEKNLFIPVEFFEGSLESFYRNLEEYGEEFEKSRAEAEKDNQRFRFIARYEDGKAAISLEKVGPEHPFYNIEGSNNMIALTTERYKEFPIVIKGYGAGAEVTAAGVFADIISIANIR